MKKYQIIYADPPWQYKDKSKSHGGCAESHYPTMSVKEICALDVASIAEENSVLLLWVTMPFLPEGLEVMKAWGFKFKTSAFTWVKTNKDGSIYMGMGRHTRANAEICILGTKGKGVPRQNAAVYNTQLAPRGKHSQKPVQFKNDIIRLYGNGLARLEMFCRERTGGWDAWGNEVESDIEFCAEKN